MARLTSPLWAPGVNHGRTPAWHLGWPLGRARDAYLGRADDLAAAVDDADISVALATSAANCEKLGDRASCSFKTRSTDAADKESQSSENHRPQSTILA
jgi:hypothetical protein